MGKEIDESIEKAISIIESCTTEEHFENASQYIELFYLKYNDTKEYEALRIYLRNRVIETGIYGMNR